ncbi:MAG: hypothetical protein HUJ31_01940 [Pseudomonadales bacterium]|nr:hypothetical protein [Pseudomonadales bacterium]
MWRLARSSLLLLLSLGLSSPGMAEPAGDFRSLDGQVQEIKSDVLSIASDLNNLEERLLYPTNTQVSLFVSLAEDEDFRLDAVHIKIDGELVTHHIYTFKELEALKKGGVQRIFTGNVTTGKHNLHVTMVGKDKGGDEFSTSDTFAFAKGVEPAALGIKLADPGLGNTGIRIGDW